MDADSDLEQIEVQLFLEAIYMRYGYDLRGYSPTSMRRRVMAALVKSGLTHLGELQHRVISDADLFASVLNDLTVHVSELFRDPSFYRTFRSLVVPVLRTYPLIRIWHAGCSTGEEAYASAIVLTEEALYDRTQIYATDLSPQAVAHAKQGMYDLAQVQNFTDNYEKAGGRLRLSDYYTAAYDRIAMTESLRRNILFFQHDLVADHTFGEMQVIFCRNVFIYFDPELRAKVLNKFAEGLCSRGFLCLGSSERIPQSVIQSDFVEVAAQDRIYRRTGASRAD
jgi:chemotaxis protein methyltransferase CheR